MKKRPDYIEYGFHSVRVISINNWKHMRRFARQWGGLDLQAFVRALQEGNSEDQVIAAFAVGYTGSAWARDLLLPYLHHDNPRLRWACVLSLGEMHDETAFPLLLCMLQEFLPPHPVPYMGEYSWFESQHSHIVSILGEWGKQEAVPALCETLVRLWKIEQRLPVEKQPSPELQYLWQYQEEVAYALGQLGALHVLMDFELPVERKRLWTINVGMGYLNAERLSKTWLIRLFQDTELREKNAELFVLLAQVLQEKMGLSRDEAEKYIENYEADYYDNRFPPAVVTHSLCQGNVQ